ncbi:hypothetical protein M405DRAFT_845216 [Rhizopogon salebrosus TDB-379]|nr:hypothetical protein M405DRAFT_845216 [Rhizopogon salebrosus TDB-379]
MHDTGTIITGSCALNMLLGDLYDSSSGDLNLIVPHRMFATLDVFMREEAGYENVGQQICCSSHTLSVSRFVRYRKSLLSVSVSQAGARGLMGVITGSNTTADMTFMTMGGVATFYPEFTLYGRNVRAQLFGEAENQIGSSKSDALSLESGTSFIGGPCGRSCPSLWRSIREFGPHGIFNWDARYRVGQVFEECDVEWRLSERCFNLHCAHDSDQRDGAHWVLPHAMPADEVDITIQERNISRHLPPYEILYTGVLYATSGQQPVLVRIPLKHCVSLFQYPCDLEIAYWVNQRDQGERVSFVSDYTHTVHYTVNGSASDQSASFTIFCESFMNLPPTNGLLSRLKKGNSADLEDGNVLIIKHPLRDLRRIQNMVDVDLPVADRMLRWALWQKLHWK